MKISCNWLRDYAKTNLTDSEIAEKLTLTGLEVEELVESGSDFKNIVIADVLTVEKHPNADKLSLCKVFDGDEELQIVCGAPNVASGQKVVLAKVGTILPIKLDNGDFLTIRKSKIRGEVSFGMICAEDELGIGTDHSGIMVLNTDLKAGTPFSEIVPSTKDTILEIGLTPNRPDAACHAGTARDLTAVTGETLDIPVSEVESSKVNTSGHPSVKISIQNQELCTRYVGIVVRDVKVQDSPTWVQSRLKSIGLRPRNAIVDATNYVLHELGQPLHAFDLDTLAGNEIVVKTFDNEVAFTTLDEVDRKVPAGTLFICDKQKPVAIAGIMGGMNSEINDSTTNILIESAWFDPISIRKSSKTLTLQSDSSYRFERGVDPTITRKAAMRCARLIQEWCGGTVEFPVLDVNPVVFKPKTLNLRPDRVNKLLGTSLDVTEMVEILSRLGFAPLVKNTVIQCTIPGFRPDVSIEVDLIEEVARIYDYNKIGTSGRITFSKPPILPYSETFIKKVREISIGLGLQEIYTNSLLPESVQLPNFQTDKLVSTLNPISKDQAVLRPSLLYGFLKSVSWNFNRKTSGINFFEVGNVFSKGDGTWIKGYNESRSLLLGISGHKNVQFWNQRLEPFTFADLKSICDALFIQLRITNQIKTKIDQNKIEFLANGDYLGSMYQVDNATCKKMDIDHAVYVAEFNLDVLIELTKKLENIRYQPIAKFPPIEFDLAFEVEKQITAEALEKIIKAECGNLLNKLHVFDVFEGKPLADNKKSIAFRLWFLDKERTLSSDDIQPVINRIISSAKNKFNATLRA